MTFLSNSYWVELDAETTKPKVSTALCQGSPITRKQEQQDDDAPPLMTSSKKHAK
jgi:hypothetical protein